MSEEQLNLIDVEPEHSAEISECAKRYKAAQKNRIKYLNDEKAEKAKLLGLIKSEELQRLEDGKIVFRIEEMTITVKPRDELVTVKMDEDDIEDDE